MDFPIESRCGPLLSSLQKQFKRKTTEGEDGEFRQRGSRGREMVIYSFSPWQLRIIKWGKKREPKSLTWTILVASSPSPHIIVSPNPTFPDLFSHEGPSFLKTCLQSYEWDTRWAHVLYFKGCVRIGVWPAGRRAAVCMACTWGESVWDKAFLTPPFSLVRVDVIM